MALPQICQTRQMRTNDLVSFTNALGVALYGKQVRNMYQTLITNNDAYYDANF